jgi:peptidoglycan hydrolase-like protein with peptidoglycan-binding domain
MNKNNIIKIILILTGLILFFIVSVNTLIAQTTDTCDPDALTEVSYGQESDAVKNVQLCLIAAGYDIPAGATGYYGEQTRQAVQRFYKDWYGNWSGYSFGPKGVEELKRRLTPSTIELSCNPDALTTVSYGQESDAVKNVQLCLIAAGYDIPAGATGYYGKQTRQAIKKLYESFDEEYTGDGSSLDSTGINYLKQALGQNGIFISLDNFFDQILASTTELASSASSTLETLENTDFSVTEPTSEGYAAVWQASGNSWAKLDNTSTQDVEVEIGGLKFESPDFPFIVESISFIWQSYKNEEPWNENSYFQQSNLRLGDAVSKIQLIDSNNQIIGEKTGSHLNQLPFKFNNLNISIATNTPVVIKIKAIIPSSTLNLLPQTQVDQSSSVYYLKSPILKYVLTIPSGYITAKKQDGGMVFLQNLGISYDLFIKRKDIKCTQSYDQLGQPSWSCEQIE